MDEKEQGTGIRITDLRRISREIIVENCCTTTHQQIGDDEVRTSAARHGKEIKCWLHCNHINLHLV